MVPSSPNCEEQLEECNELVSSITVHITQNEDGYTTLSGYVLDAEGQPYRQGAMPFLQKHLHNIEIKPPQWEGPAKKFSSSKTFVYGLPFSHTV
jgi:hypothetical protein